MFQPKLSSALFLAIVLACQTHQSNESQSPTPQSRFTNSERSFIHADSELFDAVVRAQLAGTANAYPFHLDSLSYDPRPYGTDSVSATHTDGYEKQDSTFPLDSRPEVIRRIAENRRLTLGALHIGEASRSGAPECPGFLMAPPPGSAREEFLAKCPKKSSSYLRVGLPIRGEPSALRRHREPSGWVERPAPSGEVWTTIVEARHVGPGGGMWEEHAWTFQRNSATGRLQLARTTLIGVAE